MGPHRVDSARPQVKPPEAGQARVRAASFGRAGTETIASPSSTSALSTSASQCSRTWRPFGTSSITSTIDRHHIADLDRRMEVQRLRAIDGAGARQPRSQHRRNQARGVKPVRDPLAEAGAGRIGVAQMDRVVVARDIGEADDVGFHYRLHQGFAHADMQILEAQGADHARVDGGFGGCVVISVS